MDYLDPRAVRVRNLIGRLHEEVKMVNERSPDVFAGAMRDGFVHYFLNSLYTSLPDDSMLVDHFPEALERMIEEIGEKEVMLKLES